MKNKKIIKIIILIISLVVLISILSFFIVKFVNEIKEDRKKTNEIISSIEKTYVNFKTSTDEFNSKREVLHNEIFVDNYYDTMETKIDGWKKLLDEYTEIIKQLDNNSTYLKNNCKTVKTLNNDAGMKCESFEVVYEAAVNSYISDINLYNESIKGYNEWANDNNTLKKLELYSNNLYKEYIDYNNDGEFFGKE